MESIKVHPIYKNYGYNVDDDNIYYLPLKRIVKQREHSSGYAMTCASNGAAHKSFMSHRFVWECCNDSIPKNYEIDHINKNKLDNRIQNLRCITISENRKNRDHTNIVKYAKVAHTMKRFIKATNTDTNEVFCFNCKNQCGKYFGVSAALVYLIAEGINLAKTANTNKGKIIFEYIDEKDVQNLIKIPHGRLGRKYPKSETA